MESINNAGQMNNRSSFTVTSNGIFDKKSKRRFSALVLLVSTCFTRFA